MTLAEMHQIWCEIVDEGRSPSDVEIKLDTTSPLLPNFTYDLEVNSTHRDAIELRVR